MLGDEQFFYGFRKSREDDAWQKKSRDDLYKISTFELCIRLQDIETYGRTQTGEKKAAVDRVYPIVSKIVLGENWV